MEIKLKRAYDPASDGDGFRVYVDKIWPRGLSHETFHYDLWEKGIAPSSQLREWFHEDMEGRWTEFERRYTDELRGNPEFAKFREALKGKDVVTLLFSSHDRDHNNAVVLRNCL